ncbi:MAG: AAA family ATPase [Oscillospiraceae bacterium]|nr:AAA family ATPase [Oscillospiraceae bacterium]
MDKNPSKEELERNLKPSGTYLDTLSDFANLLGTIKQAEDAAKELLDETSSAADANKKSSRSTITDESDNDNDNVKNSESHQTKNDESEVENEEPLPTLEEMLEKLDALVGLDIIKQNVKSLINYVKVRKLREDEQLPNPPLSLHMVFMGNPGTGKTTVARILSELYRAIGVLSKGQLVEVDRSGLVAGFVGQTAIKTSEVITSALGGILFIDEAYSLAPDVGSGNDFGRESIETLLKMMEDHRDDLIVIVAGYSEPMERFIGSNPGLESRFNRYFMFEDYNSEQLYEIFSSMCAKSEYVLTEDAVGFAQDYFRFIYESRDDNFGNARHVRNYFENIVAVHSDRVSPQEQHTREDLTTVTLEDMQKASVA